MRYSTCEPEVQSLVTLILRCGQVGSLFRFTHLVPSTISDLVPPHVEELGSNEEEEVVRDETE